jgi:hypothetical protein
VPAPGFGIRERAGRPTHHVDNSNAGATDDGNPNGSPARPRRTVPATLPAGSVVEVRGGPYPGAQTWTSSGSAAQPVFVRGVGGPVFTGDGVRLRGSYLVAEGLVMDGARVYMGPGDHLALRSSEVRGYQPGRHSAAVAIEGTDVVVLENEIHHNGVADGEGEEDVHGIKADSDDLRLWIVDNHIHHNGGDSVQIGSARSAEPWAKDIYIARNHFHDDRENGIDIKKARDVVISENRIHSYRPSSSSAGEAIVVHDDPDRVWVVNNEIFDAARGIVCTGAVGFYVVGNLIHRIHNPPDAPYDADSMYGAYALLAYSTAELHAVGNTFHDVDGGVSFPTGERATVTNNILSGLARPSHHVAIGKPAASLSVMSHNLIHGPARIRWGSSRVLDLGGFQSASGQGRACVSGDPRFRDAVRGDFALGEGSPALDAGTTPDVYGVFQRLYGLDITRDRAGNARPQGRAFDLGALERP